jgi:hypothetical protein
MVEAFHSIVMQAMKLALDKANVFVYLVTMKLL